MVVNYCRIDGGNFGDDLNTLIWSRLFPDLSTLEGRVLIYGVGTLLDGRHNPSIKKVVLGTGVGEVDSARPDKNWDFRWVRGPKSAQEFNLPGELGIGDSALLWPELSVGHDATGPVGVIPHYGTWDSYDWNQVAANAGMLAINPRQAPSDVVRQVRGCSRILSESLHGAICADAMGIPWAACILAHRFNEFKWRDWLATVQRPYAPFVTDRPLVRTISRPKSLANRLARLLGYQRHSRHPSLRPVAAARAEDAMCVAAALSRYGSAESNFTCSKPADVARQKKRMLERCEEFARDYNLSFSP